jgi:chemotaxis protein MotA
MAAIASGVGAAFTSTIYGLALANLLLLPAAHRIRARAAETFEIQELIMEGVLCLYDGMYSKLIRQRLDSFLPGASAETTAAPPETAAAQAGQS